MPTTTGLATDFITFSRPGATGGGATVTDADGKIKWAGHNLLTNSESFDASAWVKSLSTVSANTHPAPNGTTTADTLAATSANGWVLSNYTSLGSVSYTFGVWLKRKTGTGNIQITTDDNLAWVTVSVTSDWALYTVSQTPTSGTKSAGVRVVTSGDEVYVWGAHLYRSDLGGMVLNPARGDAYYPTTPRSAVGYSEDFANAGWTKDNILAFGSGSVSNASTAPNGLQTADLIVPNTTSGYHYLTSNQFTLGVGCHSIYVKPAGYTKFGLRSGAYAEAAFNLTGNGTVLYSNASLGATLSSVAVSALSDGWYRVSYVLSGAVNNRIEAWVLPDSYTTGTIVSNWTPNGTSGVYLWGAQLSDSASLDAYSPVYGAAVTSAAYYAPRLDYDPVTLAARGLLVEEQRANISLHSNDFSQSAWTKINLTNVTTKTTGPDAATDSGTLLNEDTVNSEHGVSQTFSKAASATTYTLSCFAKVGVGRTRITMAGYSNTESGNGTFAPFDLSGGQTGSLSNRGSGWAGSTSSITPVGNGWYRCTLTVTTSTGTDIVFQILNDSGSGTATQARAYAGTVGNGCYIYGAQLEAGSFATSYIPNGSAVAGATRTADVASVSTQAFPYSDANGSLVVSGVRFGGAGYGPLVVPRNTATTLNDRNPDMSLGAGANGAAGGISRVDVVRSGSVIAPLGTTTGTYTDNTNYKVGYAYATNDFATVVNGGTANTQASGGAPPNGINQIDIGNRNSGSFLNGWVRQITYIPRRLTNAELQSRTA